MDLHQRNLPLNTITSWPDNPRTEREQSVIEQLAANIAGQGVIMPLIVIAAPVNGLYFTIDGETRRQALELLVNQGKIEADHEVGVKVLDPATTSSQLMAIAIAANSLRQNMTDVDYFVAFSRLLREGMKLSQIADLFNMSIRHVRGLLALADLVPEALDLVRKGMRSVSWAQAMTMASPVQQQKIVARIDTNPHEFETSDAVKAELRNAGIPETAALFDPALLADSLAVDLFSEQFKNGIFTDPEAFWKLQNAEIDKLAENLADTHADVKVIRGTRFDDTGWTSGGAPDISTAVIIVHDDGSVTTREGMIPPASNETDIDEDDDGLAALLNGSSGAAGLAASNDDDLEDTGSGPLSRPTRDTAAYLDVQARMSMRLAISSDTRLAKAVLVASTLTRNAVISTPLAAIAVTSSEADHRTELGQSLAYVRETRDNVAINCGIAGSASTGDVVAQLMAIDEAELDILFNWAVAESCRIKLDDLGASLHQAAGLTMLRDWRVDDVYLDSLSNAQIRQLAEEMLPLDERPSDKASIRTVRQAIASHVENADLQADWTGHQSRWLPPQVLAVTNPVPVAADITSGSDASDDQADSTLLAA